jgi:plastocyanin
VTLRLVGSRGRRAWIGLTAVLLLLVAPGFEFPARAEFREISIVDDEFQPASITVRRGDTVVWVHRGQRPHGVRANDGSFDSTPSCSFQDGSGCMRSGDRYSKTFDKPGTFSYFCPVHGRSNGIGMAGQVTVADSGGGGGTSPPTTTTTTRPATTTTRPAPPTSSTQSPSPPGPPADPTDPSAAPSAPVSAGPPSTAPEGTIITVPTTAPAETTTSLVALPVDETGSGNNDTLLIGIAAAVVLAAAIGAAAWRFRPGYRSPGGPPAPPLA